MKNFLYILLSCFFMVQCSVPKDTKKQDTSKSTTTEKVEESKKPEPKVQLIAVLKNPDDIVVAKEMINNSGIRWEKLAYNNKSVKIGLIEIPKEKTDFWLERLPQSGEFKKVALFSEKNLKKLIEEEEQVYFSLRKTPCFGDCPSYNLVIDKKGNVIFFGEKFALKQGKHTFQLTEEQFETLNEKLGKKDFATFSKKYDDPRLTDLPSTFIMHNGNQIKIRIWKNVPSELIEVHEYIEQILLDKKMIP